MVDINEYDKEGKLLKVGISCLNCEDFTMIPIEELSTESRCHWCKGLLGNADYWVKSMKERFL